MKKYTNQTSSMKVIEYADGDAQFLMRGQSITTDKEVVKVQEGLTVRTVVLKQKNVQTKQTNTNDDKTTTKPSEQGAK